MFKQPANGSDSVKSHVINYCRYRQVVQIHRPASAQNALLPSNQSQVHQNAFGQACDFLKYHEKLKLSVASLGLVSLGAATDGVTPIFF